MKTTEELKEDKEILKLLLKLLAEDNVHRKKMGGSYTTTEIEENILLRWVEKEYNRRQFTGV